MKALFSTAEAAEYLGYSTGTIAASRKTGTLAGVDAPKFIKMGNGPKAHVRYELDELNRWIDQAKSKKG